MAIGSLSLKVPVPCIRGHFGTRIWTYQTNIKTADIHNLLGHDPVNALANIDWSKANPDWVDLLGTAELDDAGQPILDENGRKLLGRLLGGEKGISNLLEYVARKTGNKATDRAANSVSLPERNLDENV